MRPGAVNKRGMAAIAPTHPLNGEKMPSYKDPDFKDRQQTAAKARQAMLEKHRTLAADPAAAGKQAARLKIAEARKVREAERDAARKVREAQQAEAAARAAELAKIDQQKRIEAETQAAAEATEAEAALLVEQKAARDARYAARKAAKKERRRGY